MKKVRHKKTKQNKAEESIQQAKEENQVYREELFRLSPGGLKRELNNSSKFSKKEVLDVVDKFEKFKALKIIRRILYFLIIVLYFFTGSTIITIPFFLSVVGLWIASIVLKDKLAGKFSLLSLK